MSRTAEYLDLENPADLAKLDDASLYLRSRSERLLIICNHHSVQFFLSARGVVLVPLPAQAQSASSYDDGSLPPHHVSLLSSGACHPSIPGSSL